MKICFLLVFLFTSLSFARLVSPDDAKEPPLYTYFSIDPTLTLGAGVLPMHSKQLGYLSAKVYAVNYGQDDIGMRFLGAGLSMFAERGIFNFSPVGLHGNHFLVAIDIHRDLSDMVGISFNYSF